MGVRSLLLYVLVPWVSQAAVTPPPVTVTVSPATISLRAGDTKKFYASVANATTKTVTWSIVGAGTMGADGTYQTPSTVPAANTVTVKATATVDGKTAGTATVTLLNPEPVIQSLSATRININLPFTLKIAGKGFVAASQVLLGTTKLTTKFVSSTELTCTGMSAAAAGTVLPLTVANPDPGAGTSSLHNITVMPPITVNVSPDTASIRAGDQKQFGLSVQNAVDRTVAWTVNGVAGGSASLGTVDATGLYKAPAGLPAPNAVAVGAISAMDPKAKDASTVTLLNPIPVATSTTPVSVSPGAVSIQVNGAGFAPGAQVLFGNAVLQTVSVTPTAIIAKGVASPVPGGLAPVTVKNPDPGSTVSNMVPVPVSVAKPAMSYAAAVRFLEQATFGADPAGIAHLQQVGYDKWFAEQLAAPVSDYDDPPDEGAGLSATQQRFFVNATTGQDQLRQRVAFALSQIWVVSGVKVPKAVAWVPWLRMLSRDAFGNYRTLMEDATLSPAMGNYLDMVNNDKPNPKTGTAANENYARELMQLFTLGTVLLKQNGTNQLDPLGNPILLYDEATVQATGRAFTGWTYPPIPGTVTVHHNPAHYFAPMVTIPLDHDEDTKVILGGVILQPGRTAAEDLADTLDTIFKHQNVGPFVALRLIQHLVTGNPSQQYVSDIAGVFNGAAGSPRGDLFATVKAILMHNEARAGDTGAPDTSGHLREPVLYATQVLRALGGAAAADNPLPGHTDTMGQKLFFSPSVFNYYSPFFRTAKGALAGPEFQILSAVTSVARPNFVNSAVNGGLGTHVTLDLSQWFELAADPARLMDAVDAALMRGQMPAAMRTEILTALAAVKDPKLRARYALYLTATSPMYQVER